MKKLGLSLERRRLEEQDGAYLIEFLASLVSIFMFILLVVQVVLVFLNAILVNHALGLAAQEAAARGGVDDSVRSMFISHLPGSLNRQCVDLGPQCLRTANPAHTVSQSTPGIEPTRGGDIITLQYRYDQEFSLLRLMGVETTVSMNRSLKVASQSAQE